MSFTRRNVALTGNTLQPARSGSVSSLSSASTHQAFHISGVRASPLDGRATTSTGTQSLDDLLAGHAGLVLGNSLLIEESGTTDYAGILLRYFAAEGVLQGHKVHVVGVGEQWRMDLPGPLDVGDKRVKEGSSKLMEKEKMKIAWRYEGLGEFGLATSSQRGGFIYLKCLLLVQSIHGNIHERLDLTRNPAPPSLSRNAHTLKNVQEGLTGPTIFCHTFDLTQRLVIPTSNSINFIPIRFEDGQTSPFSAIIENLNRHLASLPSTVHRLIIPAILSPAFYPSHASTPQHILQFLQSLRFLLRQHSASLTAMITLPLMLYPRSLGLVRWMEILSDGVLELTPFPHHTETGPSTAAHGAATLQEERPQGMVNVHRLPVFHEVGGGGARNEGVSDDLAFTVSRKKFAIEPFNLPPVEGDSEAQRGIEAREATKANLEF